MARNSRELARRPAVDPAEEPSAEWGWHGHFPNAKRVAGVFSALFLLAIWFLNPTPLSGTEIAWVVGTALLLLWLVVTDVRRSRHAWRR